MVYGLSCSCASPPGDWPQRAFDLIQAALLIPLSLRNDKGLIKTRAGRKLRLDLTLLLAPCRKARFGHKLGLSPLSQRSKLCPCGPAGRTQSRSLQRSLQIRARRRNLLPSARGDSAGGFSLGAAAAAARGLGELEHLQAAQRVRGQAWAGAGAQHSCSQTQQASQELLMDDSIISLE